uniref:NADH-ubiquinone oxidoreductase chain 4L n=1 Tax=Parastacus brasiliensis TaxID=108041 RepID=A0A411ATR6_9EUCA|nr:NADH dehydrogenase subunit 4L [Parastacus brasiliensis]
MSFFTISEMTFLGVVLCGLSAFVASHKHLLNTLLSLEFIMLGVFGTMSANNLGVSLEVFAVMFFLILVVCEGALGLSLLVSIVRSHGNDYFSSFGTLSC